VTIYTEEIKIPANTSEDDPETKEIVIQGYILEKIHILIPHGHQALAGLRIKYGLKQIIPYTEGTWIKGEGESLTFTPLYELPEYTCKLILEGYNEDDTYNHSFFLRFETKTEEEARPGAILQDFIDILKRILRIPG
jgi:hypothetical protein